MIENLNEEDEGVTWLTMDTRRLSVRESWRLAPNPLVFAIMMVLKLLRVRVEVPHATPREFLWVDRADSVPEWAAELFAREEPALVSAGLRPVMTYSVRQLGPAPGPVGRVFMGSDGRALAQLMVTPPMAGVAARIVTVCTSLAEDGTLIATTNNRMGFDPAADVRLEVVRGDAGTVVRRHAARLAGLAVVACAADGVRDRLAAEHARAVAASERRGLQVPLSPAQVAALTNAKTAPAGAQAALSGAPDSPPPGRRWPRKLLTVGVWCLLVVVFVWAMGGLGGGGHDRPPPPRPAKPRRPVVEAKATEAQLVEALAPLRDRLEASKRPVARVRLERMAQDDVRVSKVGGEPYLAAGASPPRAADGGEMVLLAQVNFAEVPAMEGYPSKGMLQFFIARRGDRHGYGVAHDARTVEARMEQRWFRVRYLEDVDTSATGGRARPACRNRCETPHDPDRPRRMVFALQHEPISADDVDFTTVVGVDPYDWVMERATAWQVDEHDLAERAFPTAGGHKLGGYPYFTQSDPRPPGTPHRLLLQLDTDEEMMWGDAGVGGFFIDPADLARRDFSRVLYSWDCH